MNVANLQQHLADLGKLMEASGGGKTVAKDLKTISDRLATFRHLSLQAFAEFLGKAEEAVRKGTALPPEKRKSEGKPPSKVTEKVPVPTAEVLARQAKELYDQAASTEVTEEKIDTLIRQLDKLKKGGVVTAAEALGMKLKKSDTKPSILKTIRQWIEDRKGSSQRAGLTGGHSPPVEKQPTAPPAPAEKQPITVPVTASEPAPQP